MSVGGRAVGLIARHVDTKSHTNFYY